MIYENSGQADLEKLRELRRHIDNAIAMLESNQFLRQHPVWPANMVIFCGGRFVAYELEKPLEPFPVAGAPPQRQVTREEIIEALREGYKAMIENENRKNAIFRRGGHVTGYPDMVKLLDYIEQHGIPPRGPEDF